MEQTNTARGQTEADASEAERTSRETGRSEVQTLLVRAVPLPRLLLLLALTALLFGRGLSHGLPGIGTGLDRVIGAVETTGAHLTQFAALLLVALCARVSMLLVVVRGQHIALTVLSVFATAAASIATFLAALSNSARLAPIFATGVAVLVLSTLLASGSVALKQPTKRAAGLVLIAAALAAGTHVCARLLALVASETANAGLFTVSRSISTLGFALEASCIVAAFLWLLSPRVLWPRAASAVVLACAPALALAAEHSDNWQLAVRRTLEQLSAHPDPLLPDWLHRTGEITGLAAAGLAVVAPTRFPPLLLAVGLAILGRSSADVPLGAMFLLTAALSLQLTQLEQEPADQPQSVSAD